MSIDQSKDEYRNKNVLITGGLGSIGNVLLTELAKYEVHKIVCIDNRETEIFYQKQIWKNDSRLEFYLGDVRDKKRMLNLSQNVDIIFHAAALKHVIVCEYNPIEAVQTNIIGTQNIIECAIENQVQKMILISTDKAVNPTNIMGATKLSAERLVASMGIKEENSTKFGVVRFGNVLATRGSVLEIWKEQLKKGSIPVTDPEMTRFFMSMDESVRLVLSASRLAQFGEIFILKMPSIRIGDLAKAFLTINNTDESNISIVGKASGEKQHEELLSSAELTDLLENDQLYVKLPLLLDEDLKSKKFQNLMKLGFKEAQISSFRSDDQAILMQKNQIIKVIKNYM